MSRSRYPFHWEEPEPVLFVKINFDYFYKAFQQRAPNHFSKEELQQQVGETLLSNMMMQDMMQEMMEQDVEVREQPKIPQKDPRTLEREQQDKEYEQALFFDERGKYIIKQPQQMDQFTEEPIFEELSPQSLRKKRMQYYQ